MNVNEDDIMKELQKEALKLRSFAYVLAQDMEDKHMLVLKIMHIAKEHANVNESLNAVLSAFVTLCAECRIDAEDFREIMREAVGKYDRVRTEYLEMIEQFINKEEEKTREETNEKE